MTGTSILERQSEEGALRLLAAQRSLYARAKLHLAAQLLLLVVTPCALAGCGLLFPDVRPWAALVSIFVLIVDVVLLEKSIRHYRQQAASVQEMFDTKVFGLEWPIWHLAHPPDAEMVRDAGASIMANAARRSLLLGWYPPAIARLDDFRSILLCQRYNVMYGIRIRKPFAASILVSCVVVFIALLSVTLCLDLRLSDALLTLAVPALPMFSWSWRELNRQIDQVATQERIKSVIQRTITDISTGAISNEPARCRIRQIQDEIYWSRAMDPLIFDWVHAITQSKNEKTLNEAAEDYVTDLLNSKKDT